jgi:regulator of protease activity HflC (stomatin/prohibitin superfamily)
VSTKTIVLIAVLVVVLLGASLTGFGCQPRKYDEIKAYETAFSVPLQGDSAKQGQVFSENLLSENKISAKRYLIPYTKIYTSAFMELLRIGKWVPAVQVIHVDLRNTTRAWTGAVTTGTSAGNQALVAETKESVDLSSEWNAVAQVNEKNAAKFVHFYYGQSLSDVMDQQVRPFIQQQFSAEVSKYSLSEFLLNKDTINNNVKSKTSQFFAERGIDILNLGMQGSITYLDPNIQSSINARIKSQNDYEAQKFQNSKRVETAEAAAKEAKLLSGDTAIKLRELDIARIQAETNRAAVEKWKGDLPTTMVPGGTLPFINVGAK